MATAVPVRQAVPGGARGAGGGPSACSWVSVGTAAAAGTAPTADGAVPAAAILDLRYRWCRRGRRRQWNRWCHNTIAALGGSEPFYWLARLPTAPSANPGTGRGHPGSPAAGFRLGPADCFGQRQLADHRRRAGGCPATSASRSTRSTPSTRPTAGLTPTMRHSWRPTASTSSGWASSQAAVEPSARGASMMPISRPIAARRSRRWPTTASTASWMHQDSWSLLLAVRRPEWSHPDRRTANNDFGPVEPTSLNPAEGHAWDSFWVTPKPRPASD